MYIEPQKGADFHSKGPWFNTKVSPEKKSSFTLMERARTSDFC